MLMYFIVIMILIEHGCDVDQFLHSKYFPNNINKKANQRWTDWGVYHFINGYFC